MDKFLSESIFNWQKEKNVELFYHLVLIFFLKI